ncbi:hypothetical protein PVAND_000400 [Polypedilum vanderplanki]|uniref:Uncharacterized protein n=1 Tax=Polypedilum vanderplanki TaxID=319348 RepID=A0A9J6BJZ6_POLVA|nr:hypothetical protein PVAND_000400 [Polypedilum vanderplanki]
MAVFAAIADNQSSNEIIMQVTNNSNENSTESTGNKCIEENCLRCNINGCIKCTKFIMTDSRMCVDECPKNYIQQWSSTSDLMGRTCVLSNVNNSIKTVMIGVVCGALLCFIIVLLGVIVFRRKQQKMNRKSIKDQLIDDEYDRHEFLRQLDDLRPHAELFLFMLNDTRKQIRKSYISGDTTASAKYYPIVRDLAKILILLNRPVELIDGPPHDWNRLLLWADRILSQYKPQQQITQLIEFLKTPTSLSLPSPILDQNDDARLVSKHTTFKSHFYSTPVVQNRRKFGNSATLPPSINLNTSHNISNNNNNRNIDKNLSDSDDDLPPIKIIKEDERDEKGGGGSLISLRDFLNESNQNITKQQHLRNSCHQSQYGDSFEHVKNYLSSGSLLVVEDELIEFKLGSRPQDEITTEL